MILAPGGRVAACVTGYAWLAMCGWLCAAGYVWLAMCGRCAWLVCVAGYVCGWLCVAGCVWPTVCVAGYAWGADLGLWGTSSLGLRR